MRFSIINSKLYVPISHRLACHNTSVLRTDRQTDRTDGQTTLRAIDAPQHRCSASKTEGDSFSCGQTGIGVSDRHDNETLLLHGLNVRRDEVFCCFSPSRRLYNKLSLMR